MARRHSVNSYLSLVVASQSKLLLYLRSYSQVGNLSWGGQLPLLRSGYPLQVTVHEPLLLSLGICTIKVTHATGSKEVTGSTVNHTKY